MAEHYRSFKVDNSTGINKFVVFNANHQPIAHCPTQLLADAIAERLNREPIRVQPELVAVVSFLTGPARTALTREIRLRRHADLVYAYSDEAGAAWLAMVIGHLPRALELLTKLATGAADVDFTKRDARIFLDAAKGLELDG